MKTIQVAVSLLAAAAMLGLAGCSEMSTRDNYTAVGTIGGAAAGGVIGSQAGRDRK
jgi:osmotically inducible lipoprotein OsmB